MLLTNVGTKANHLEAFLAEPFEYDGCVESTTVCENDLGLGRCRHVAVRSGDDIKWAVGKDVLDPGCSMPEYWVRGWCGLDRAGGNRN